MLKSNDKNYINSILLMTVCGVLSGLLTQFWVQFGPTQAPLIWGVSIWPGIFFGLAISCACVKLGGLNYLRVFPLIIIVILSWVRASKFSDATFSSSFNEVIAYMTSGLIGSGGTALGVLLLNQSARKVPVMLILLTIITGTVSTLLVTPLYMLVGKYIHWFAFPLWQASVAAANAYSLIKAQRN